MKNHLIPECPNWLIQDLQNRPRSFFLMVYDAGDTRLIGTVLAASIKAFKCNASNVTYRIFRYQPQAEEPTECVLCHREGTSGFTLQQNLEVFICTTCCLGS